ncbi:NAD dependent epimerase/dehydratase [Aspergillus karnatakaensis]|uniref:sulfotransferase family protein n=1 Tax=Aspergillus karnatakaensis TaxID=1810916 RepID=UPI003CCD517E
MASNTPFPAKPYPKMEPLEWRRDEMKVLAFGLPRTGTMSLSVALNQLGYNCYHMTECCLNYKSGSLHDWHAAIEAKYNNRGHPFRGADFDRMLGQYDAITDFPSILFVEDFMDAYPNAQIILTTRSTDAWLPSMQRTINSILGMKRLWLLSFFDYVYLNPAYTLLRTSLRILTASKWYRNLTDDKYLLAGYEAHNALVRGAAQSRGRKVLEYRVEEGWAPLCRFLNRLPPFPDTPFPRVSEGDFIKGYQYIMFWVRVVELGVPVAVGVGVFWLVCWGIRAYVQLTRWW